eukprot:GFUD01115000.1.p1 GENE.GFUD01115000.1~~GFUD01115000.1.p1  ORF type:complete len:235 (+),score=51.46 GFUD01115000.1:55-705(+)
MKTAYEANSALGDPMSIQGQLTETDHRLDKLRSDLRRCQAWSDEAEGSQASKLASRTNKGGSSHGRSSMSDEMVSLSRSSSDSSVNHHKNGSDLTSQGRSSNSPESGLGNSHLSLGCGGTLSENLQDNDAEEEIFEPEPLPVLGRCQALYTFDCSSEGSISLEDGEELWLIETDQGDGWTRVRRLNPSHLDPMPEGFVPTSYIDTTEMFDQPQTVE